MFEHRHPHLEKFVEIVRDDAQVTQPFQQRYAGLAGHRKHTEIEFQRRQLAAEVEAGGAQIKGVRG